MPIKSRDKAQFGDFQTPWELALEVVKVVGRTGVQANTVIEPSCGKGAFLIAAAKAFPEATLVGVEVNGEYLAEAGAALADHRDIELIHDSFFDVDWQTVVGRSQGPVLIVGNPPWVTSSQLGSLGSANVPSKSNFQRLSGLDALTGKSNFDISEWMLLQNLSWLQLRPGAMAVLCKTAVARKVARFAWKHGIKMADARIYPIDAAMHFRAAVDACLFYVQMDGVKAVQECGVFDSFDAESPCKTFGYVDGSLVSDVESYQALHQLRAANNGPKWRSGIKHDCAKVMELDRDGDHFVNGFNDKVELENTFVFPLSKSSDVGGKRAREGQKFVIVPQRKVGDATSSIEFDAPLTWKYLTAHEQSINSRTSSIYNNKPRFSIFGVGEYSFAPFKVAISGLYKGLEFKLFGPRDGKPMMFDDTVYFLPFPDEASGKRALRLLLSEQSQQFLKSMVFWDDKRPVTADLLRRLSLANLATELEQDALHPFNAATMPLFASAC